MRIITQETFDEVVLQNITEFDYTLEEAISDTVEEFELQGVQLSNIVQNHNISEDKSVLIHEVIETLKKIKCDETTNEEYILALKSFTMQCNISLAHRVLANKHDAYNTLIGAMKTHMDNTDCMGRILQAITALTATNSDILDSEGISIMMNLLSISQQWSGNSIVVEFLARWCTESCLMHENNRQSLFEAGIPAKLTASLKANKSHPRVVIATCRALRAFALDDDIRQAFGKAHDHARSLVEEHKLIIVVLSLVDDFLQNGDVTSELLSTVSRLCVRTEYCQEAVDNGALSMINNILVSFPDDAKLNKQAINLLMIVSGNDNVKDETMKIGASQLVIASLIKHQVSVTVCEAALGAISMLSLRSNKNSEILIASGAADALVQAMKIHPKEKQLQKLGCMAIRNLVSRMPQNIPTFVECQVEPVIHLAMENFKIDIKDLAKAALRDLKLDVHLEEQWKGTGRNLQQ